MNTGLYVLGASPLHRLNPLMKLIAVMPTVFFLTLVSDPWIPLLVTVGNAALVLALGNISLQQYLRSSVPMLAIALGIAVLYPLAASSRITEGSPIVWSLGSLQVHEAGIVYGAATALRLYSIFCVTLVFVMTTSSSDLIRAMIQQWKLNERFGYGTLAVFRFIPDLRRELEVVQAAHRVRGMTGRGENGRLLLRLKRYMVPLLAAAIRRAERTAYSMDARGFGSRIKRTFYRTFAFTWRDWVFLLAYWIFTGILIAAVAWTGHMGDLSFLKLNN